MTPNFVLEIGKDTIMTALYVVGPVMLVGFVVGVSVSLFQAVTQIQEMTLAFVPKLIAIGAALILTGNFMLQKLMLFTHKMLGDFAGLLHL